MKDGRVVLILAVPQRKKHILNLWKKWKEVISESSLKNGGYEKTLWRLKSSVAPNGPWTNDLVRDKQMHGEAYSFEKGYKGTKI